jgi:hypothetical protein
MVGAKADRDSADRDSADRDSPTPETTAGLAFSAVAQSQDEPKTTSHDIWSDLDVNPGEAA